MSEQSVDDLATGGRVEETVVGEQPVDDLATGGRVEETVVGEQSVDDLAGTSDAPVDAIVADIRAAEELPLGEQPARYNDLYRRLAAELEDQ